MNLEQYTEFVEKIVDGDNREGFYRNATVEEVLEYVDKIMKEVEFMEEFVFTRASVFNFVASGTMESSLEDVVTDVGLRKVEGELYYDDEDGLLYVLSRAKKVGDNAFVTEEGEEFYIQSMFSENEEA